MEEEPVYEMKLTNGIGEQMLAHVIEQFDVSMLNLSKLNLDQNSKVQKKSLKKHKITLLK